MHSRFDKARDKVLPIHHSPITTHHSPLTIHVLTHTPTHSRIHHSPFTIHVLTHTPTHPHTHAFTTHHSRSHPHTHTPTHSRIHHSRIHHSRSHALTLSRIHAFTLSRFHTPPTPAAGATPPVRPGRAAAPRRVRGWSGRPGSGCPFRNRRISCPPGRMRWPAPSCCRP